MSEESSEFDQQIQDVNNEMQDEREEKYGEEKWIIKNTKGSMTIG